MTDSLAFGLTAYEARQRRDPLSSFDWPSEKHRRIGEFFASGIETHHRAGNQGAKTHTLGAMFVSIAQRRKELGGVKLPYSLDVPDCAILVPSYKQAIDSSNKAVRRWLGNWPHDIGWINKSLRYIGMVACAPFDDPGCSPEYWGKILFVSQDANDPDSVLGQRWFAAGGDEPPDAAYWREARKNARYRIISETPLDRSRWEWIAEDFKGTLWEPKAGRVECVTSLYDNKFLSDAEREALVESYANDPYKDARIWGHYLNLVGDSPWGPKGSVRLQELQSRCLRGRPLAITIPDFDTPMVCRQWFEPRTGEQYILSADLSEGLDDGQHDPARFDILARRSGRHALSWRGHEDAYHVGLLAAHMGEAYHEAWVDFDATGGYGQGFMRGLLDYRSMTCRSGYRRIVRMDHADDPGKVDSRFGYKVNDGVRAEIVSSHREWLSMPIEQADSVLRTWDSEALDDLLAVRMVRTPSGGMKVASKGKDHDEAMFTLGRLMVLNKVLPWLPEDDERVADIRERLREEFGRDVLPINLRKSERVMDSFGQGG